MCGGEICFRGKLDAHRIGKICNVLASFHLQPMSAENVIAICSAKNPLCDAFKIMFWALCRMSNNSNSECLDCRRHLRLKIERERDDEEVKGNAQMHSEDVCLRVENYSTSSFFPFRMTNDHVLSLRVAPEEVFEASEDFWGCWKWFLLSNKIAAT